MTKFIISRGFYGARDSHDEVIDRSPRGHALWKGLRGRLWDQMAAEGFGREPGDLLPIDATNDRRFDGYGYPTGTTEDRRFGMPRELAGRHADFQNALRSIVFNVGTLLGPVTGAQVAAASAPFPSQFDAHNQSQTMWQSGAGEALGTGWIGRLLEAYAAANPDEYAGEEDRRVFESVTLGANVHELAGPSRRGYNCGARGEAPRPDGEWNHDRGGYGPVVPLGSRAALRAIIEGEGGGNEAFAQRSALGSYVIDAAKRAAELNAEWNADMNAPVRLADGTTYEPDIPGQGRHVDQLRTACRIIARAHLDPGRFRSPPVMAISLQFGGWDDHNKQAGAFNRRQAELDRASRAETVAAEDGFLRELIRIGCWDDVYGIEWSDFGRTMTPNSDGTDHAWGQTLMPFGGAIRGRTLFGAPPAPSLDDPQVIADNPRGIWVPTISVEQYLAPVGRWLGFSEAELIGGAAGTPAVFPGLASFPVRPGTTLRSLDILKADAS